MRGLRFITCLGFLIAMTVRAQSSITTPAASDARPGIVNVPVNFTVSATSSTGSPLTYLWKFGDGTMLNGSSVTHTFTTAGVYNVQVGATDGTGTNVVDHLPFPVIASGDFTLMGFSKGKGKLSGSAAGTDTLSLTGFIPAAAAGSNPAGQTVTFNFAGIAKTYTLNKSGRGTTSDKTSTLVFKYPRKFSGGKVTFTLTFKKQIFLFAFVSSGYDPTSTIKLQQIGVETAIFYQNTQVIGKAFLNLIIPNTSVMTRAPNPNVTVSGAGEILSN